jgi:16S rRNA (guanine527-N7)-methyltransferase
VSRFREVLLAEVPDLLLPELDALEAHYRLMVRWNQRLNLTRIDSEDDAARFHYVESIFLARHVAREVRTIVDVGSGAGFPGIPCAIVRPEWQVTLVEADQRKAVFLKEASRSLPNIKVMTRRAEDVRENFELLISRAVAVKDLLALPIAPAMALLVGGADAKSLAQIGWDVVPTGVGSDRFLASVSRET